MRSSDPKCEALVKELWCAQGGQGENKMVGVQCLGDHFKEYKVGTVSKELKRVKSMLKEEIEWDASEEVGENQKALLVRRNRLLHVEEVIWRQKSRALWLEHGDKNTKYFHRKVDQRRKTNAISKLKDDDGVWWRGEEHCERLLVRYFFDLFSSSMSADITEVCYVVKGKLKPSHVSWCERHFTNLEVKKVLFQMHPIKALGLDGLPALFFQKYWHLVGPNMCNMILGV